MSLYGIRPNLPGTATPLGGATQRPQTTPQPAQQRIDQSRIDQSRIDQSRQPAAGVRQRPGAAQPAASNAAAAALPVQPPPGTDPELWSVLSPDERAFFAKAGAMGPLTYGRMLTNTATPPSARGGRLDVKA
jgi:hypothetical protein